MANKFQNALYLLAPDGNYIGQVISRWLVEFCTQIVGMSLLDSAVTAGSWTATITTGTDGASVVGQPAQLSAPSRSGGWTTTDIGRYITLTGMSDPSKNGIYRISGIISSSVVVLDIKFCVHEDGIPVSQTGLNWRLWDGTSSYRPAAASGNWAVLVGTYSDATTFHVKIDASTDAQRMPSLSIGPWATWNAGSHVWSDSRNTTARAVAGYNGGSYARMFAVGDTNRVMFGYYCPGSNVYGLEYFGEFTPAYGTVVDPKPACTISGGGSSSTPDYVVGAGRNTGSDGFANGTRFLSANSTTVISGTLEVPTCTSYDGSSVNSFKGWQRRWSMWSRKLYRFEILLSSLTAGYYERRGTLNGMWATGQDYMRAMPFGSLREYLHWGYGIVMHWNGSKVHFQAP
jgi:hypothetical protein